MMLLPTLIIFIILPFDFLNFSAIKTRRRIPTLNIVHQRLQNQLVAHSPFRQPDEVVRQLGCVQAQDYLGSLWAIGLRLKHSTERLVEKAIAERTIVRTWPMRGTLHFVASEDVRWMLRLLTPRVIARSATLYKQNELDGKTFIKCKKLFLKALEGGTLLTRNEMYQVLERANVSTAGQRGLHILGHLAQEGLLCFGTRSGKQQTFTLLDEWVPHSRALAGEEALGELATRYFASHGPATLQDYTWWSGLSPADARASLEIVKPQLAQEVADGKIYWMPQSIHLHRLDSYTFYLLPAYDEYTVAYKDRAAILDPIHAEQAKHGIFSPVIVLDGQVTGTWKRTIQKNEIILEVSPFKSLSKLENGAIQAATERYSQFMKLPVHLSTPVH